MIAETHSSRERQLRGELVCNLCGRTAATVQGPWAQPFVATHVVIKDGEHASAVRRLGCPHCGGRLMLQHQEEIDVYCRPFRDEDEAVPRRRGHPRRSLWG